MIDPARMRTSSLRDLVRPGHVGSAWCDGREILRRIFVTVRDRQWQEVKPTHFESAIDESDRSVTFKARHVSEEVGFEWRGTLKVGGTLRELRFAFEGKALRDMEVCRLGLVVLHPVESMLEARLSAVGPHGNQCVAVPRLISPQPFANGFPQAMTESFVGLVIERPDFGRLELRFAGDLFELEDQRNWGDASFKTYCTPLRLGFPRAVKAGTVIEHSVEARFTPPTQAPVVEPAAHRNPAARVFPTLGREFQSGSNGLAWHHILFQINRHEELAGIQAALESAPSMQAELQVEVGADGEFPPGLLAFLSTFRERISRLLICGPGGALPSAEKGGLLRSSVASSLPLLAATRGYFVEFNRAVALEAPVSGIAFPLTATVHSDDPATIAENVATVADIAETARHLTGLPEVAISPLALYYPSAANPANFPGVLIRPWLAATLIHAALSGITSITLGADLLEALSSEESGGPRFISGFLECAGFEVSPVETPLPAGVHAALFKSAWHGPARVLIANLNAQIARFDLARAGLTAGEREVEIPSFGTTWIELRP